MDAARTLRTEEWSVAGFDVTTTVERRRSLGRERYRVHHRVRDDHYKVLNYTRSVPVYPMLLRRLLGAPKQRSIDDAVAFTVAPFASELERAAFDVDVTDTEIRKTAEELLLTGDS